MLVPGGNLLGMALRVINPQGLQWQQFTGRARNAGGDYVNTYAAAATIQGSFQPMDAKTYQALGLDLKKTYATLYTPQFIQTTNRNASGDLVTYNGKLWQGEDARDWTGQDGWGAYVFVQVNTP